MKRVVISVTNDLSTDKRMHKTAQTLVYAGYNVTMLGRKLPQSKRLDKQNYGQKRFSLIFSKGPLFYAEYNIRLFLYLLFGKYAAILSVDLDTLPAAFCASKLRRKQLVYDSHELFTEVPELIGRNFTRAMWLCLERFFVPKLINAYTVSRSIALYYRLKYNIPFAVVPNYPSAGNLSNKTNTDSELQRFIDSQKRRNRKLVWYHGAVNRGRGIKELIDAMYLLDTFALVVVGIGDLYRELRLYAGRQPFYERVLFAGELPFADLYSYAVQADVGFAALEDLGASYRFSLPNRLFDYTAARLPFVVSNLPEIAHLVNRTGIGMVAKNLSAEELSACIRKLGLDTELRGRIIDNQNKAAKLLAWELNEPTVLRMFD